MIAPADRIVIEQALRVLLREEQRIQPTRLTNAEIVYRQGDGIVLLRPAAETRRQVAIVPQGVMDHRQTEVAEAIAWGAWSLACTLRSLPGQVQDAEEAPDPEQGWLLVEPNEDHRREALMRAIEAAPIIAGPVFPPRDIVGTGAEPSHVTPTAEGIIKTAGVFAKFIAGREWGNVEPEQPSDAE